MIISHLLDHKNINCLHRLMVLTIRRQRDKLRFLLLVTNNGKCDKSTGALCTDYRNAYSELRQDEEHD